MKLIITRNLAPFPTWEWRFQSLSPVGERFTRGVDSYNKKFSDIL
jgi:hypothetical protein